jgi:hypothetical protein
MKRKPLKLTRNSFIYTHAALRLRIEACEENDNYRGAQPFRRALKWLESVWQEQQRVK